MLRPPVRERPPRMPPLPRARATLPRARAPVPPRLLRSNRMKQNKSSLDGTGLPSLCRQGGGAVCMGLGPVPMSLGRWMCSARASLSVCERAEGVCFPPVRFEDAIYCRLSQPRASWSIGRHLTPCTQHFSQNRCRSGAVRRVVAAGLPRVYRRLYYVRWWIVACRISCRSDLPHAAFRAASDCLISCLCGTDCLTLHFVRWVSTTYFSLCGMLMPHIDTCVVILASTMRKNE